MSDKSKPSRPQVIRSVSVKGYGRTRLTLQSVCGGDGSRYIRAVWEYKGDDGLWYTKPTPPEFTPRVWTDAIATAATKGMLSSADYKDLLVRLTRGIEATKTPTPKAYVGITGRLHIVCPETAVETGPVNEVLVYEALSSTARDVTVRQSHQKPESLIHLDYTVVEDLHYTEAMSRLPEELRAVAISTSLEDAVLLNTRASFLAIFGDPQLGAAGFGSEDFTVEFDMSVL